jgi:hypothetical protein
MQSTTANTCAAPNRGWHRVRIGVAVLLLTASALKCWQLATEPIVGTGLLESRWLLMATVEFELLFGFWLLANNWARPTWAAALACFALFTCVSLCKAISGHATCGCFGRVAVNPWYTGTLDVAIVLSLLRWRPKESFFAVHRATVVLIVWLAVGIPAAYAMGSYTDATLSDAGKITADGKVVVLEPERWVGKRFPLLDYIDIGNKLKEGGWTVLLYHWDCPRCKAVMADMIKGKSKVVCVEVPPFEVAEKPATTYIGARLKTDHEWFVATPVILRLVNGSVVEVHEEQQ